MRIRTSDRILFTSEQPGVTGAKPHLILETKMKEELIFEKKLVYCIHDLL
jgi:hypothetical protein